MYKRLSLFVKNLESSGHSLNFRIDSVLRPYLLCRQVHHCMYSYECAHTLMVLPRTYCVGQSRGSCTSPDSYYISLAENLQGKIFIYWQNT